MKIIFHKAQPIGKIRIERNTKSSKKHEISITRNDVQLEEGRDYSLRETEIERELTVLQDFAGQEAEVLTIINPPH